MTHKLFAFILFTALSSAAFAAPSDIKKKTRKPAEEAKAGTFDCLRLEAEGKSIEHSCDIKMPFAMTAAGGGELLVCCTLSGKPLPPSDRR